MVHLCSSVAAASPRVTAEIVEASAFADLVAKYRVGATPKLVVNEDSEDAGPLTAPALIARLAALPGPA